MLFISTALHSYEYMEQILVTGSGGFIGRHLVSTLLLEQDTRLILADKFNQESDLLAYSKRFKDKSVSFYNLDIRDRDAVFELFKQEKVSTCIHLAGRVNVQDSIKNPTQTMDVNVKGTLNILDACALNQTKNFIFASSAAVYGHPTVLPIPEDHVLAPLSPYGTSKMLGEQTVSSYRLSEKIQNAISLRIFNAYGIDQFGNTNVISQFAKRLSKGLPPIIYGDGLQGRDFISVADIVGAILLTIKAMEDSRDALLSTSSCVFNIGTGVSTSINEVSSQMIKLVGLDFDPIYLETNDKTDVKDSCADITKAKEILEFTSKHKLEAELKNLVKHMISTIS